MREIRVIDVPKEKTITCPNCGQSITLYTYSDGSGTLKGAQWYGRYLVKLPIEILRMRCEGCYALLEMAE
ncbi:MAG: hypothetical protein L6N94_00920 [Candidatus Methylarchaceae archaeon HK01M]|nr:hypothetical protein [Candidatus Methylarchaceae archaeon HK01M]